MELDLENLFYREEDIPAEFALDEEIHQREFLSNGTMHAWSGNSSEVFSPICIKTKDGLVRKRIGSYPVCTEKESMEADRKSTRLNSSHVKISYAVFCLKKKKKKKKPIE